jgi:hypothetical protein
MIVLPHLIILATKKSVQDKITEKAQIEVSNLAARVPNKDPYRYVE